MICCAGLFVAVPGVPGYFSGFHVGVTREILGANVPAAFAGPRRQSSYVLNHHQQFKERTPSPTTTLPEQAVAATLFR